MLRLLNQSFKYGKSDRSVKSARLLCYIFYHSQEFDRATPAKGSKLGLRFPALTATAPSSASVSSQFKNSQSQLLVKAYWRSRGDKNPCGCCP
ncbi:MULTISPECIES: hypothetical protein [unclassified Microcoleus]|uniref:hypothetical protein n=1 Tax=unclassified Microcoleus TaxID=2642155 RepID=UPI00312B4087